MSHIICFTLRSVLLQRQGSGSQSEQQLVCCGILPKPYIKVRVRYGVTPARVGLVNGLDRELDREALLFFTCLLAEHFKCEAISIVLG